MHGLRRFVIAIGVSVIASALCLTLVSEPAWAAGPRPLFQLPFPCGESWHLATYGGHDDYDIDMTANSGVTRVAPSSPPTRALSGSPAGTAAAVGW
jgi:hypothetical protein